MSIHRVLILFAHPSLDRSEINISLAKSAQACDGIDLVDLYAEYPDFQIDIDREQQRLLDHDVIIFLHPLYWYSTPAILKEWQDLVLEHGFAYGTNGDKLHGKIFFNAISAGGPEDAYMSGGFNNFKIRELLFPLEQTANLCGMIYLPPFALFSSRTAVEDHRLKHHMVEWTQLLESLRDDLVDISQAQHLEHLNANLDQIILTQHIDDGETE